MLSCLSIFGSSIKGHIILIDIKSQNGHYGVLYKFLISFKYLGYLVSIGRFRITRNSLSLSVCLSLSLSPFLSVSPSSLPLYPSFLSSFLSLPALLLPVLQYYRGSVIRGKYMPEHVLYVLVFTSGENKQRTASIVRY